MKKQLQLLYYLSSLLLLLFLISIPWTITNLSSIATHSTKEALVYKFAIPVIGFFIGSILFLSLVNGKFQEITNKLHLIRKSRILSLTIILIILHSFFFAYLAIERYNTFHSSFFDLTIELHKIWLASETNLLTLFSETLRFQPLFFFYGLTLKIINSPIPFLALQPLLTTSAVIPLFLLSTKKLKNPLFTLAIVVIFLYYPPIQYNSFNDLHLDHLYIPLMMWAFYFAEQEKYPFVILLIVLSSLIKEPLILGAAFFSLYLALTKKKYFLGVGIFIIFSLMFYFVTFIMLPSLSVTTGSNSIIKSGSYSYLLTSHKQFFLPVIKEIFKLKKIVYLIFLFLPLLFLPLLAPATLLPALPLLGISILSTTPEHCAVNSHYTVGIIPPAFTALVFALDKIRRRWGDKMVEAVLGWTIVLTLSFNIAHSPAPISVNFWSKEGAGGIYSYSQYQMGKHEKLLAHVIYNLLPENPEVKIVCHSKIAHNKISARYFQKPFPEYWEIADYILLDHTRLPMVVDRINREEYWQSVREVDRSGAFKKIFNEDGIVLYSRVSHTDSDS